MVSLYQQYILISLEQYTSNFGFQYNLITIFAILPEITLFLSLLLLIINLGNFYNFNNKLNLFYLIKQISYYSLHISLIILIIPFIWFYNFNNLQIFQNTYNINIYTQIIKIIIVVIALILYQYLNSFLRSKHITNICELPLLFHICIFLTFIIISCAHYAILLLALEGFSLTLYILTTIDRTYGGITASVKYFTFGTLGSILLFWGVAHYYALFPNLLYKSLIFVNEYAIINNLESTIVSYNFAGLAIILGLLIKLGAAPIHQWVPDVYGGSALIITALFTTIVKIIIFIIYCSVALYIEITPIIFVFGFCSLIIGSFVTIRQVEIKRFLAYSSISHVGFLLIGDLPSSYIYLITYVCASLLFFLVLFSIQSCNKELIYLTDLRLIKKSGLWNTFVLVISLASMAGLPPFSGFFGKFLIWSSLVEDIYLYNNFDSYFLLIVSVVLTLITIFYYMRLIVYIYVSNDNEIVQNTTTLEFNSTQVILVFIIVFWILLQPKIISIILYFNYILINTPYDLYNWFKNYI